MQEEPLFSFGVIADTQFADKDDGRGEGRVQRYREAPEKLRTALRTLAARQPPLAFVLSLGDIIDGNTTQELTLAELELMVGIFDEELGPTTPRVHVLGNHCLSAGRAAAVTRLRLLEPCHFTRALPGGWRLLVLDTTEMSGHSGVEEGSPLWQEARAYEAAHPLSDENPHMNPWNGGIGRQQLEWLRQELARAEAAGERVIVASHHPVGEGAARPTHLAWNWREISGALLASPAFCLALAGHDHLGGYAEIAPGRHFMTAEAVLEAPPGSNAFGVVQVYADRVVIEGDGQLTSRVLPV